MLYTRYYLLISEENVYNVTTTLSFISRIIEKLDIYCSCFFPLGSCTAGENNCDTCSRDKSACETCDKGNKPDGNGVCQGIRFVYTVVLPHPTITYITVSFIFMLLISVLLGRSMSTKYVFLELFMPCLKDNKLKE